MNNRTSSNFVNFLGAKIAQDPGGMGVFPSGQPEIPQGWGYGPEIPAARVQPQPSSAVQPTAQRSTMGGGSTQPSIGNQAANVFSEVTGVRPNAGWPEIAERIKQMWRNRQVNRAATNINQPASGAAAVPPPAVGGSNANFRAEVSTPTAGAAKPEAAPGMIARFAAKNPRTWLGGKLLLGGATAQGLYDLYNNYVDLSNQRKDIYKP